MTNQRFSKKILNICIICIIIVAIIFTAMMLILNYDENGETNMPFEISKISIVSTVNGQDVENSESKWDINVIQNNDIYIYIKKNDGYKKQETIKNIKLDNITILENPKIGEIKVYKPTSSDIALFENIDENIANELEFKGTKTTDAKKLEISNQGGVLSFRCANNNIGTYTSNDDEEINYNNLISKLNIDENSLISKVKFNITITLNSGKVFRADDVELQIPNEGIVQNGTVGKEYTDLQSVKFKRIGN